MKLFYPLALLMWASLNLFGQNRGSAEYISHEFFENKIKVSYKLNKGGSVSLYVSTDGGATYNGPLGSLTGDYGCDIKPHPMLQITWDAPMGYDKLPPGALKFKIVVRGIEDISLPLVFVVGGTFAMGNIGYSESGTISNEVPVSEVTLSDYYIGQYEVTQDVWVTIMGSNPSYFIGDSLPVDNVSLNDARRFAFKLSQITGFKYRIPTEAEWEYAARGGFKSKGYKFPGGNNIEEVGWTKVNSEKKTHPVGTKMPNELGIYDMCGNVMEWCNDYYGPYTEEDKINPTGPVVASSSKLVGNEWIITTTEETSYVMRGGSWTNSLKNCHTTKRFDYKIWHKRYNFGVRVVRER